MLAIDAYGEFEIPEEKATIEVNEDPVKTAIACYELFGAYASELEAFKQRKTFVIMSDKIIESLYEKAEKILEEKQKLNLNLNQIIAVVDALKNRDGIGLFLSALQNNTDLSVLPLQCDGKKYYADLAGYKLKKNKWLIIGSRAKDAKLVGYASEGNVINYGDIYTFSWDCKGGIKINNGQVQHMTNGASQKTLVINNSDFLCLCTAGILYYLLINNNPLKDVYSNHHVVINLWKEKELSSLKQKLDEKLKQTDFLKADDYDKSVIKKISELDFTQFEKDITAIANEIKEADERLKCRQ